MENQSNPRTFKASFASEPCSVLGPYPVLAVATLADLGLTDQDIAGYFRVRPECIARLRRKEMPELRLVCGGDASSTRDFDRE